jgi:hypothetical protein
MVPAAPVIAKETPMRQLTATPPAPADPAPPERDQPPRGRSRIWAVLEAMAYAGAVIDPSGVLATQRFRRIQEEQHGR